MMRSTDSQLLPPNTPLAANAGVIANVRGRHVVSDAAMFYSLLYLDVASDVDVEGDLVLAQNSIAAGHFWYGVWATAREFTNALREARYTRRQTETLKEALRSPSVDVKYPSLPPAPVPFDALHKKALTEHNAQRMDPFYPDTEGGAVMESYREIAQPFYDELFSDTDGDTDAVLEFLLRLPFYDNVLADQPEPWFQSFESSRVPALERPIAFISSLGVLFRELDWTRNYGGDGWAGVCDHLERIRDPAFSTRLWADQSFSIEHNTGEWLNKLTQDRSQAVILGAPVVTPDLFDMFRENILDPNQRGNMGPIFEAAAEAQDKTDQYDAIDTEIANYVDLVTD